MKSRIIKPKQHEIEQLAAEGLEPVGILDAHGNPVRRAADGALVSLCEVVPVSDSGVAEAAGIAGFQQQCLYEPAQEQRGRKAHIIKAVAALAAGIAGCYLLVPAQAQAADVQSEIFAQDAGQTLDMKVSGSPGAQIGFFARQKVSVDQDGIASYFGLADISHPIPRIIPGVSLSAVAEVQAASGAEIDPRIGLSQFSMIKGFGVYGIGSYGLKDGTIEVFGSIDRVIPVSPKVSIAIGAEGDIRLKDREQLFRIGSARVGLQHGQLGAGIGLDAIAAGGHSDVKPGAYLRMKL